MKVSIAPSRVGMSRIFSIIECVLRLAVCRSLDRLCSITKPRERNDET
jgi:hypothetical protein